LTVTGCFYYVDADDSNVGARNIWVRVWDDDILFDDLLWEGVAGTDGCWTATGLTMEEESPSGNQDIYVEYSTWTDPAGKVEDTLLGYYSTTTPTTSEVSTSPFDSGSWLPPSDVNYRAAFRMYAYLEEAWRFDCAFGIGQDCMTEPTAELIVNGGSGAYYQTNDNRIRVEVNGDYDRSRDVVTHERGHFVMDRLLYEDGYWPPGAGGAHTWCDSYTQGLAWTEGWATFYAVTKGNWLDSSDTSFEYGSGWSIDLESGLGCDSSTSGDSNEYRVGGSLWDIRDSVMDGVDTYATPWDSMWSAADDCTSPTFRSYYDGTCSWVSHGLSRPAFLFPAWQNYIDYNVAPTATIVTPNGGGWLRGSVTVSATVSDPDTSVLRVDLYVSHNPFSASCTILGSVTSGPILMTWDTTGFVDDSTAYACAGAWDGLEYSIIDLSDTSFGVDNTPPASSVTLSGTMGNNDWYISQVTATHSGSDATSGIALLEYDLDSQGWADDSGIFQIDQDGMHTLYFRSTDNAGNVEVPQPILFKMDTTPPQSSVDSVPPYHQTRTVTFTCSGQDDPSGSGLQAISLFYSIGGGAWTAYPGVCTSGAIVFVAQSDGTYDFRSIATDWAGNAEAAPATPDASTIVDTVAPTVSFDRPSAGGWVRSTTIEVAWTTVESGSGIERCFVSLDGGASVDVAAAGTHTLNQLSEGSHIFLVGTLDRAGNSGESSLSFKVDVTPPQLNITDPKEGSETAETLVTASWSSVETGSGIDRYEVRLDDGAFVSVGKDRSCVFEDLANGRHTVTVKAVDVAGNEREESVEFTVNADTGTGGGGGGIDWWLVIASILVIVSFCLIVFAIWWRRRSRKQPTRLQSSIPPPPPGYYPEGPVIQEETGIEPPLT